MKSFSEYSDEELIGLSNEELNDSIRREAINRGIKPPITFSESLRNSEWRGFQVPAEYIRVYHFASSFHRSEFGYLTEERAIAAMEGLVRIESSGYGASAKMTIRESEIEICSTLIGVSPSTSKAAKFEEAVSDESDEFIALRDECIQRFSDVRQAAYDTRVNEEKRAEYLRLAGGDEEIAKRFWSKTESAEWPCKSDAAA